jgi:hypothetical protein
MMMQEIRWNEMDMKSDGKAMDMKSGGMKKWSNGSFQLILWILQILRL